MQLLHCLVPATTHFTIRTEERQRKPDCICTCRLFFVYRASVCIGASICIASAVAAASAVFCFFTAICIAVVCEAIRTLIIDAEGMLPFPLHECNRCNHCASRCQNDRYNRTCFHNRFLISPQIEWVQPPKAGRHVQICTACCGRQHRKKNILYYTMLFSKIQAYL